MALQHSISHHKSLFELSNIQTVVRWWVTGVGIEGNVYIAYFSYLEVCNMYCNQVKKWVFEKMRTKDHRINRQQIASLFLLVFVCSFLSNLISLCFCLFFLYCMDYSNICLYEEPDILFAHLTFPERNWFIVICWSFEKVHSVKKISSIKFCMVS
jgi:hypothetical protein